MASKRTFWRRLSLLSKFLLLIVPLLIGVSFAFFALFNRFAENEAAEALKLRMENVASVQAAALAGPVWVLDDQQISLVLTAMTVDADIRGVLVADERGDVLASEGALESEEEVFLTVAQPIEHAPRAGDEPKAIGVLRIAYSTDGLVAQSRDRLFFTLAMASIMSLIAVGGAVLALRTSVNKPLALFLDRIRQQREGDESEVFVWDHNDEIGTLVAAYNELQASQIQFRNELADIRDKLELRVEERTKDLREREAQLVAARDKAEETLEDLRNAQARLVEAEKMASLGQLTAGIAHEIKNPLNFVNNFSQISMDLLNELLEDLSGLREEMDAGTAENVDDVAKLLTGNLAKINEHGARADSIVRNMLAHSRGATDTKAETDVNALAKEAMALVYHGLRAERMGFNIAMKTDLAKALAPIVCYPQELQRALMNILMNGMQAAAAHHAASGTPEEAEVSISTRMLDGERVEIRITDNGPGIPEDMQSQIFNPFFTTKPPGEGTGLGLSMTYDIIVGRHGGDMKIESAPGEYSTFVLSIPTGLPDGKKISPNP